MSKKKTEDFTSGVSEVLKFYEGTNKTTESKKPETSLDPGEQGPSEKRYSGLDVSEKEYKSERVQFLLKPSIKKDLKELADQLKAETGNQKISMNEIVNQVLETFLKGVKNNND